MSFLYKESKSKTFLFWGGGEGVSMRGMGEAGVHGRTNEQALTNLHLQLLRSWGITMHKCTSNAHNKLNL